MQAPTHPDAVAPERFPVIETAGVRLQAYEWGDPAGAPIVLVHGFFDHGRGFDMLAPLLAEHFRVLSIDARGHGDSEWMDVYTWPADVADLGNVLAWLGRPAHLLGHSRGGGQVMDTAALFPDRVRQVVDIDGFGPPPEGFERPGQSREDLTVPQMFAQFLDSRRRIAERPSWRPYPEFEDLVERRCAQNPRLSRDWARYFVYHGAREVEGGWSWKVDPTVPLGFGPWQPEWIAPGWKTIPGPVLGMVGNVQDVWGPLPEEIIEQRLRYVKHVERATIDGTGHFVHMEKPAETARVVLDFLER